MKGGDVRRRDEKHKHLRKSPATCVRLGRHRYLESRTEGLQYRTMPGTKQYQHVIETPEPGEWEVRPFLNFSLLH